MNSLPIRVRPASEDDVSFIFSSWLKSYRNSLFATRISNNIYYENHHRVIERLLKENQVMVACSETDPNQIYGYICAGTTDGFLTVHYVYVKQPFRSMGIGKTLLNSFNHDPAVAGLCSHYTRISEALAPRFNLVYYPYILFDLKLEESVEQDHESSEK